MSVYDMRILYILEPELLKYRIHRVLIVTQLIVGVLLLLVRLLVSYQIPLEGGHLVLAKDRRLGPRPDIVHIILTLQPLGFVLCGKVSLSRIGLEYIIESPASIVLSVETHRKEFPVLIHRYTAVIEQIVIIYPVHASLGIKESHMALQLLAAHKGALQSLEHLLLFRREPVRISGVDSGEVTAYERIRPAAKLYGAISIIYAAEQQPVVHTELGTSHYQLSLQLHLHDKYCLVYHLVHGSVAFVVILTAADRKGSAVRALVGLYRIGDKRHKIDAVALLKCREIAVYSRQSYHGRYGSKMSRGGSHPDDIMVAPLDIHRMILYESIHYYMGTGSSVVYVADYMKMIYHKSLYKLR